MSFANILRKIRIQKGLSQNQLAKIAGLTSSAICQFEAGDRNPSSQALKKISEALDVSSDYLLELKDNNKVEDTASDRQKVLFRKLKGLPEKRLEDIEKIVDALSSTNKDIEK